MDKDTRNTLRNVVTNCRRLLEEAVAQVLEGQYGVYASGRVEDASRMGHLSPDELAVREQIVTHLEHIRSGGFKPADAADQLIREIAFTHLNRLAAYKMMEQRGLIREAVSRGVKSQGFMFYLADHADEERLWSTGQQELAYRHFLVWQSEQFADEISVLFSPYDSANFVFPPQRVLDQVLDLINSAELADIWTADETIGWVYQYFTPKELRDKARSESQAPRNSYELAFRNQFYTPRYVVEFLTDNTLGRTWYEMLQGDTALIDHSQYLVRRPKEIFLASISGLQESYLTQSFHADALNGNFEALPETPTWAEIMEIALMIDGYRAAAQLGLGQCGNFANSVAQRFRESRLLPSSSAELWICLFYEQRRYHHFGTDPEEEAWEYIQALYEALRAALTRDTSTLSQEELLQQPVYIPYRALKDPRRLKVLDPACGSGHFLLYAFDLLAIIYEEAWERGLTDQELGMNLRDDYASLDDLRCDIPRLILRHNLHGIDIDRRATQIAALALWLRAQRYYNDHNIDRKNRPAITQGNIVVAEPMPGDRRLLDEFTAELESPIDQMVKRVFNEMKLAGEAGSLLKIEEAIQDDIARAREEWERRLRQQKSPQQMALLPDWIEKKPEQLALFDVSKITDAEFFDRAEHLVLDALEAYAQRVENGHGLRRRLFADDAAGGFAFIELMRRRYDVVLMNPPFGEPSMQSVELIDHLYPYWSKNILCAMIIRGTELLTRPFGAAGAIVDRTVTIKSSYEKFRQHIVNGRITALADTGWEVLEANVETTCPVLTAEITDEIGIFLNVLEEDSLTKGRRLRDLVIQMDEYVGDDVFLASSADFSNLPNSVIGYQFGNLLLTMFSHYENLAGRRLQARQGHALVSSEHFRLFWEIQSLEDIGKNKRFAHLYNGGDFSHFYSPYRDVTVYGEDAQLVKDHGSVVLRNPDYQFFPGIGYGKRGEFLDAHILKPGVIFTSEGQAITRISVTEALFGTAFLNSGLVSYTINQYCGQHKHCGYVNLLPVPPIQTEAQQRAIAIASECIALKVRWQRLDETVLEFAIPFLGLPRTTTLTAEVEGLVQKLDTDNKELTKLILANDAVFFGAIPVISSKDRDTVELYLSRRPRDSVWVDTERDAVKGLHFLFTSEVLSHVVGSLVGRWDIRYATGERPIPELPDPFDPLPACPPGMLQNADGLPATETPPGYPLDIDWDGILVDDPGHPDDIIRRVRGVLEVLWGDRAEAIEQEACETLGVKTLRDYFRKPGSGGFWDDHVKRYSKSRRKAPIYWLLQSSRKNYALWLYYHRLDKDLYYKALINYVQPKLRLERSKLDALRAQLQEAGVAGREAKRLEREVEQQEALMSELQDFHDALERTAQLNLVPDLNDGVVLNIAPLHELVPWKEAATYWKALLKGEYEWSTISQQLRNKGLVK